jgi:hypothetical protein
LYHLYLLLPDWADSLEGLSKSQKVGSSFTTSNDCAKAAFFLYSLFIRLLQKLLFYKLIIILGRMSKVTSQKVGITLPSHLSRDVCRSSVLAVHRTWHLSVGNAMRANPAGALHEVLPRSGCGQAGWQRSTQTLYCH